MSTWWRRRGLMPVGHAIVLVLLAAGIFGLPIWMAQLSKHRGVTRGGLPKHPFTLPRRTSWYTSVSIDEPQERLPLPPVDGSVD
jgi:hypothetical protein